MSRTHTAVDQTHRDMELSQVQFATIISVSERPVEREQTYQNLNLKHPTRNKS
jgi:hypothetical protein